MRRLTLTQTHGERRTNQRRLTFILGIALLGLVSISLSKDKALSIVHSKTRSTAAIQKSKFGLAKKIKNWGLINAKSKSHIQALDAWSIEKGSQDIVVAVIDTGIDSNHKDLESNLWKSRNHKTPSPSHQTITKSLTKGKKPRQPAFKKKSKQKGKKRRTTQGNVFGWDFVKNQPNPTDTHGHGTHVAGIIGAIANPKVGISGVAQKVSIMAIKYYSESNSGLVNVKNTILAIEYAVKNGAKIINYSGGGPTFSEGEYLALKKAEEAGILVVAAAGNENQNIDLVENYYYPSAYRMSNIISVAATDINNKLLPSSNWGAKKVDVAAPGENIYSTMPGNQYGYMSGTSQATAFVSGLAALLLSKNPNLTPKELKRIISESVDRIPHLKNKVVSGGRVNAYTALKNLEKLKNAPSTGSPKTLSSIEWINNPQLAWSYL